MLCLSGAVHEKAWLSRKVASLWDAKVSWWWEVKQRSALADLAIWDEEKAAVVFMGRRITERTQRLYTATGNCQQDWGSRWPTSAWLRLADARLQDDQTCERLDVADSSRRLFSRHIDKTMVACRSVADWTLQNCNCRYDWQQLAWLTNLTINNCVRHCDGQA